MRCLKRSIFSFLHHLYRVQPQLRFHSALAISSDPTSILVRNQAIQYDYVIVHGKRFYASTRTPKLAESLIAVRHVTAGRDVLQSKYWVGELTHIFSVADPRVGLFQLGHVRWFCPSPINQSQTP